MLVPSYFAGLPMHGSHDYSELLEFCELNKIAVLASLPWFASELAGREGFEALFSVQRTNGGRRLYLPRHTGAASERLGAPISEKTLYYLHKGLGDSAVLDIPSSWGIFIAIRRAGVTQALQNKIESHVILKAFGISQRQLKTHLKQQIQRR